MQKGGTIWPNRLVSVQIRKVDLTVRMKDGSKKEIFSLLCSIQFNEIENSHE